MGCLCSFSCFELNCKFPEATSKSQNIYPVKIVDFLEIRLHIPNVWRKALQNRSSLWNSPAAALRPDGRSVFAVRWQTAKLSTLLTGVAPPSAVRMWMLGTTAYCKTWISCLFFKVQGPLASQNLPFLWHSSQRHVARHNASLISTRWDSLFSKLNEQPIILNQEERTELTASQTATLGAENATDPRSPEHIEKSWWGGEERNKIWVQRTVIKCHLVSL